MRDGRCRGFVQSLPGQSSSRSGEHDQPEAGADASCVDHPDRDRRWPRPARRSSLSRDIEHVGSAHDDVQVEALKAAARQRLTARQRQLDLGLERTEAARRCAGGGPLPITTSQWRPLTPSLPPASQRPVRVEVGETHPVGRLQREVRCAHGGAGSHGVLPNRPVAGCWPADPAVHGNRMPVSTTRQTMTRRTAANTQLLKQQYLFICSLPVTR